MIKMRVAGTIALLLATAAVSSAQTVNMSGAAAGSDNGRPSRGMSQASVESVYGSPVNVVAAVGDPPITRWEYANFVVFFEYDRVIHAVVRR